MTVGEKRRNLTTRKEGMAIIPTAIKCTIKKRKS